MGSCRYCAQSVSSVRVLMSHLLDFLLSPPAVLQMAQLYSTQRRNRRHSMSCDSTRCTPSSCLLHQLPTVRSTVWPHQHATHSRSYTSQILSTVTASSCPQDGTVGEKSRYCGTASTQKRGARRGSTTFRPSLASMDGAKQVRGKCTRRSFRTKVSRHASFLLTAFPFHSGTRANADADRHSRPRSHRSTTQRQNKRSWRRITTRTHDAPTAIHAACFAAPWTPPRHPLRASSGH